MSVHRYLLTDTKSGAWQERFEVHGTSNLESRGSVNWSVRKESLRGGPSDGVDAVMLNSGYLSLTVLPTRGMGIWEGSFRGLTLGWNSPVSQPVHPRFVPMESPNGLGWLRGFNEFLCRCGLTSNGPPGPDPEGNPIESPLPLHGRIANLSAHRVELEIDDSQPGTIRLTGVVDESTLFGSNLQLRSTIEMTVGGNDFTIRDVVTNRSAGNAESQLLYHINVGPPFLEEGSRFVTVAPEIVPRDNRAAEGWETWNLCGAPQQGFAEQVYFAKPTSNDRGESFVMLRNRGGDKAVSVHFGAKQLPCLSMWKNTAAIEDGYVVGLEPATNFPNHRSFERAQGRVVSLGPGESYETELRIAVHDHLENVAALEAISEAYTAETPVQVHRATQAGWSP